MGFTFDDTDRKGVASSLAEMRRLIEKNPRNQDVIFPYIGGQEVNTSPTHAHHRYVINFHDFPLLREDNNAGDADAQDDRTVPPAAPAQAKAPWVTATDEQRRAWLRRGSVPLDYPEPVAADWPDALAIVRAKVKPARVSDNREAYRRYWWKYAEKRAELTSAIAGLERVLVLSRISNSFAFTFLPTGMVYNEKTIVFPFEQMAALAILQSRLHEVWARSFSSTLKDDLQYTPSDCFESFPFPDAWRRTWPWNKRAASTIGSASCSWFARAKD